MTMRFLTFLCFFENGAALALSRSVPVRPVVTTVLWRFGNYLRVLLVWSIFIGRLVRFYLLHIDWPLWLATGGAVLRTCKQAA